MIASVTFRNFKALRNTSLALSPFNLVVGPNGSGKTSLIQALLLLRGLTNLPIKDGHGTSPPFSSPEINFRFNPPFEALEVRMSCSTDFVCDLLKVRTPSPELWSQAMGEIRRIRSYLFDHYAMAEPARCDAEKELSSNGGNLAAVVARWKEFTPSVFDRLEAEFCRFLPEFGGLELVGQADGRVALAARLAERKERILAESMSQGTLYVLATLVLAFDPTPPSIICIEEIDRGIHPRLLREVRDAFYRLSHPESFGEKRAPVQIVATTHSPYLLDLFKDHPEEVVIAQKEGQEARFERLVDRPDFQELLDEGPLGDIWFSGILGGVPEEKFPEERK
ncbi:MAG: AAA family ATPase [Verrucomicrobia bacterium]|nr:AAA family ATPase [Verrucomicrobiota bacterium]